MVIAEHTFLEHTVWWRQQTLNNYIHSIGGGGYGSRNKIEGEGVYETSKENDVTTSVSDILLINVSSMIKCNFLG